MTRSQLTKLIREEIKKTLNEATAPTFKAKHKNNNLVASMYFSWNKAESNNSSFWNKVIQTIEQEDCKLVNYVVTDSVCEFEFKPNGSGQMYSQDLLEDAKNRVDDALEPIASQCTGYDVYIYGN